MISLVCFLVTCFLIQNSQSLQCWKCTSEYDITCRDHFNITRINQNRRYLDSQYGNRQHISRTDPRLETCDEMYTAAHGQKNVCLKQVYRLNNGMQVVKRECRLVPYGLRTGYCPEDLTDSNRHMDHCSTCDYDGCNSANIYKTNIWSLIAPLFMLWFLKK